MRTSPLRLVLPVILLVFSSSCTMMDLEAPTDESEVFKQPEPEFPHSEREKRREGWVLVTYSVSRGGLVHNIYVEESSGNSKFEEAALNGVREWRYAPSEQRELNALINFVDGQDETPLSQKFYDLNRHAHELIDEGELERAHELLVAARDDEELHPSELAYSFLTEGRISDERGERAEQLRFYRKAMLDNGRWLAREDYQGVLYVAIVLELDQGDFVSAVHDYEVLTETRSGKRRAADLEEIVQAARARIDADVAIMQPYAVADSSVTVLGGPLPDRFSTIDRQREPGTGRHGFSKQPSPSRGSGKD